MSVVLRFFTGPHMGAELSLEAGIYTFGSSLECDIVLHDSSVAPQHCTVLVGATPPFVRIIPLEGQVIVGGEALDENAELQSRTPCFLGLTCLAFACPAAPLLFPSVDTEQNSVEDTPLTPEGLTGQNQRKKLQIADYKDEKRETAQGYWDMRSAWDEVSAALHPMQYPGPDPDNTADATQQDGDTLASPSTPEATEEDTQGTLSMAELDNETTSTTRTTVPSKKTTPANNVATKRFSILWHLPVASRNFKKICMLGVLLMALGALIINVHHTTYKSTQSPKNIEEILNKAGFSNLTVSTNDKGPVISGRLADDAERGRLVRLVRSMHFPIYLDVHVDGDMAQALLNAFNSRELYPEVRSQREGEHIGLFVSGYMKDGLVEAWALAGAKEDLSWLESFMQEDTKSSVGTLHRSIRHEDDVERILRPALEAAGIGKTRVSYLPGTVEVAAEFDVEGRSRLDKTLKKVRKQLGVPIVFQVRELPPPLPQAASNKTTELHPAKNKDSKVAEPPLNITPKTPMIFKVTGVTMTPMRFITLASGERIFTGGMLPGGYTLETISPSRLTLRRDGQTSIFTLRGANED